MATGQKKKFDAIFSHLDTIHQCDGQTPGDSIALCGKNLGISLFYTGQMSFMLPNQQCQTTVSIQ